LILLSLLMHGGTRCSTVGDRFGKKLKKNSNSIL
jgi:hypothetical protein